MTGLPAATPAPAAGAPAAPAVIRVENLHLHFGGIRAVDGVTLQIEEGSITGLIGPNGAGADPIAASGPGRYSLSGSEGPGAWPS